MLLYVSIFFQFFSSDFFSFARLSDKIEKDSYISGILPLHKEDRINCLNPLYGQGFLFCLVIERKLL